METIINPEVVHKITTPLVTNKYLAGNTGSVIIESAAEGGKFVMLDKLTSNNGVFMDGVYGARRMFYYTSNETIQNKEQKVTHELTLLNESGNSIFPNNITAKKFVVANSSSQYLLLGDGSTISKSNLKVENATKAETADYITGVSRGTTYLTANRGGAYIVSTAPAGSFTMVSRLNSSNGVFLDGVYNDKRIMYYTAKSLIDSNKSEVTHELVLLNEAGDSKFPGSVSIGKSGAYMSGNKNAITGGALYSLLETKNFNANHITWLNPGAYINNGVWPVVKSDIPQLRSNVLAFPDNRTSSNPSIDDIVCKVYTYTNNVWTQNTSLTEHVNLEVINNKRSTSSSFDYPAGLTAISFTPRTYAPVLLRYLYFDVSISDYGYNDRLTVSIYSQPENGEWELINENIPLKFGINMVDCNCWYDHYDGIHGRDLVIVFNCINDALYGDEAPYWFLHQMGAYGSSPRYDTDGGVISNMSKHDHLYDWDYQQNMYLPSNLNVGSGRGLIYGVVQEASDERLKEFNSPIDIDLDKIYKLKKSYFTFNDDKKQQQHIGISAQELQNIYPELVHEDPKTGMLTVEYSKLAVVALGAVDKLYDRYKTLEEKIQMLETKINSCKNDTRTN